MSFPHEDSGHTNNIEEIGAFLDSHHPSQYLVFNLSGHSYDTSKLGNQVRRQLGWTSFSSSFMVAYHVSLNKQMPALFGHQASFQK